MSYKENSKLIGRKGIIKMGGLEIEVEILDYKNSYGRDRWLVQPLAGSGEVWIESVEIME